MSERHESVGASVTNGKRGREGRRTRLVLRKGRLVVLETSAEPVVELQILAEVNGNLCGDGLICV